MDAELAPHAGFVVDLSCFGDLVVRDPEDDDLVDGAGVSGRCDTDDLLTVGAAVLSVHHPCITITTGETFQPRFLVEF